VPDQRCASTCGQHAGRVRDLRRRQVHAAAHNRRPGNPDIGRARIDGADVTRPPARKRRIGFVFQHYAAFTHMTVRDNVAFGLKITGAPRDHIRQRVTELLEPGCRTSPPRIAGAAGTCPRPHRTWLRQTRMSRRGSAPDDVAESAYAVRSLDIPLCSAGSRMVRVRVGHDDLAFTQKTSVHASGEDLVP
jgi:hypothetical protein